MENKQQLRPFQCEGMSETPMQSSSNLSKISCDSGFHSRDLSPFFSGETCMNQAVLKNNGYVLVGEKGKMLVKNKQGDLFAIKTLRAEQDVKTSDLSNLLQKSIHPHIVHHREILRDEKCLYLILENCEGGDLSQTIKLKEEKNYTFNEIVDWIVKICMALKHLHDQEILHKNLQPKSFFFTACGTVRLGEFGIINEWSTDTQTTETNFLTYTAPENLNGKDYDEKSEIWSLGCVIYEICMLKCAFTGKSKAEIETKILSCSYEPLPENFSKDLRELVKETLQIDPARRPSVSEILTKPFILKHLYEMSTQTIEELMVGSTIQNGAVKSQKVSLKVLEELADGLEKVHFNTTVGSLTGGVVGLAGGITSIVGLILSPFTLGASLIVTGVGIGVSVAGGVAAGVSNITKVYKQRSNQQKIKLIITEIQEKITSTSCCIQNIQKALETQPNNPSESNRSMPSSPSGANEWVSAGARFGRGLGGIAELVRLAKVASVGKVAAQTARAVQLAEAATGILTGLFVALDVFFIALDAKELHNYGQDSKKSTEQELRSEIMKFVKKTRETIEELRKILRELKDELRDLETKYQTHITRGTVQNV